MSLAAKTVSEHIRELRYRLFISLLCLLVGTILGFLFYQPLLQILLSPLKQPLYYTSPAGGVSFIFTLCLLFGIIISLPFFMYQAFKFIEPAMPRFPQKLIAILIIDSCLLMTFGIGFAYFISLPAALNFLSGFGQGDIKSLITAQEYFSFTTGYLISFGILFQLPLIMLLINATYNLKVKKLFKIQGYIIVLSFIIAAILTPTPDPVNQALMAIPIIILYYVSLLLVGYVNKKRVGI